MLASADHGRISPDILHEQPQALVLTRQPRSTNANGSKAIPPLKADEDLAPWAHHPMHLSADTDRTQRTDFTLMTRFHVARRILEVIRSEQSRIAFLIGVAKYLAAAPAA